MNLRKFMLSERNSIFQLNPQTQTTHKNRALMLPPLPNLPVLKTPIEVWLQDLLRLPVTRFNGLFFRPYST